MVISTIFWDVVEMTFDQVHRAKIAELDSNIDYPFAKISLLKNNTFRYVHTKLLHWFFEFEWAADIKQSVCKQNFTWKNGAEIPVWWKRQNDECALHVLKRLSDSVSTPYAYNLFLQTDQPVDTSSHSSTGPRLTATLNHSVQKRTT